MKKIDEIDWDQVYREQLGKSMVDAVPDVFRIVIEAYNEQSKG
jgi:hypothetical protein